MNSHRIQSAIHYAAQHAEENFRENYVILSSETRKGITSVDIGLNSNRFTIRFSKNYEIINYESFHEDISLNKDVSDLYNWTEKISPMIFKSLGVCYLKTIGSLELRDKDSGDIIGICNNSRTIAGYIIPFIVSTGQPKSNIIDLPREICMDIIESILCHEESPIQYLIYFDRDTSTIHVGNTKTIFRDTCILGLLCLIKPNHDTRGLLKNIIPDFDTWLRKIGGDFSDIHCSVGVRIWDRVDQKMGINIYSYDDIGKSIFYPNYGCWGYALCLEIVMSIIEIIVGNVKLEIYKKYF